MNPLLMLERCGQSYWLDDLTRAMLVNGELERRVARCGLRGVTSNPAIFHKAIAQSSDYDDDIARLAADGSSAEAIYEALVTADVRRACDVLAPVYERTHGADGYVSLEVSPHLADDSTASIAEAKRLRGAVGRENLLVKIPGTAAGLDAIEELIFEGVPVNVTLLFSVERYAEVADAYTRALERRVAAGRTVPGPVSVASFFLSRIDVLVDGLLERRCAPALRGGPDALTLRGKAAVANAKLAYARFKAITMQTRWRRLAGLGARVQRLLWASTSTKNPEYSDVMYVEPLIGAETVNTMPERTIAAFADHGRVSPTLEQDVDEAEATMQRLASLDIDFHRVTEQLLEEGIAKFIKPYDALLAELDTRRKHARRP
jgi:transaldolase